MASQRRVPISFIVEELLELALRPAVLPMSLAVKFPPADWDGSDLRERLYWLRLTQQELAAALYKPQYTVNEWVTGNHTVPQACRVAVQEVLRKHKPGPILGFKIGSRSPKA